MTIESKLFLAAIATLWVASMAVVARRSQFRTFLKYVDALAFLPLLALVLPPSVYLVNRLAPLMKELVAAIPVAAVQSVIGAYHATLGNLLALSIVALLPGLVFWGWRRMLSAREQSILERRAAQLG